MKINEFRFLGPDEPFIDRRFLNWSRCYEWGYVLGEVKKLSPCKIHNTCCGPSSIHKQFHDALVSINADVVNSDLFETQTNKDFKNFIKYDLLFKNPSKYDLVLCISTLEEIKGKTKQVFDNLLDQVNSGGRLIITCDYPDVEQSILENIIGAKCSDVHVRLNGSTSIYKNHEYSRLNIILIDIEK